MKRLTRRAEAVGPIGEPRPHEDEAWLLLCVAGVLSAREELRDEEPMLWPDLRPVRRGREKEEQR